MATLMLVNPKSRGRKRKVSRGRKRRSYRRNPTNTLAVRRRARRAVASRPHRRIVRRRRNPISMRSLSANSLMNIAKQAAIGGAGSISMDMLMAWARKYLPASLQPSATGPGVYDAVYALAAVVLGKGLSKSTKGLSEKMAAGALTVQAARLLAPVVAKVVPAQATAVNGMGYITANRTVPYSARVGANGMRAYTQRGARSPLLSAYVPGAQNSPLLSGGVGRAYAGQRAR